MKIVVQRVKQASVSVNQQVIGKIQQGYLLYVCFEVNDTIETIDKSIHKIMNLRIFEDDKGKMNQNITQISGSILSVSQFTLSWDGKKGHRPSFENSMNPMNAKILYRKFNDKIAEHGVHIEKGQFGAEMLVESINDGPVTFHIDF